MRIRNSIIIALALVTASVEVCAEYGAKQGAGYIDTHVHLGAMGREGAMAKRRSGSTGAYYREVLDNLIYMMNEMGVEMAVIMPPPKSKENADRRSSDTPENFLKLAQRYPGRIFVAGGGNTLNPMIHGYSGKEVTPAVKEAFTKRAEALVNLGIVAFGETAALHLSMQEQHIYSAVQPDHPLYLLLADIAARHSIPIDLHMEAVPEDMYTPEGLLRTSSRNPEVIKANIPGLERLLAHNRKAKIVWQHIGWDNLGTMDIKLFRRLLKAHPNLYLSMRIERRLFRIGEGGTMLNRIVDRRKNIHPEWLQFISEYPDRLMMGSDEFIQGAGGKTRPQDSFHETWSVLNQLPPPLARKVGRDNAARIYNLE
ncbi:MAG: amidohydrolase family protein [Candidatus Omnitrophica bacterium]|nr:amidohydrolase family protein [Candidatus Omnitrophota bacterium]